LIKTGKATYPVIGVSVDMSFAGSGARISDQSGAILAGGPASKAGLKAGDVIIEFDGRDINSPEELIVAVRSQDVGDVVKLTYLRKGQRTTVMLTLTAGK
jgi:putative serine protease PepD